MVEVALVSDPSNVCTLVCVCGGGDALLFGVCRCQRSRYMMVEYNPPLDSCDMGMDHWHRLAQDIQRHYAAFDAFIITHGTDTMAYTASALSFMLEVMKRKKHGSSGVWFALSVVLLVAFALIT